MASPFKSMSATSPSRDSSFIKPGRYLMRIEKFYFGKSRKNRDFAVLKMQVVAVLDPSAAAAVPEGPHRIGDKADWMLMADNDMSAPNLKAAFMTITEVPESEITDEAIDLFRSDAQPLRGIFVEVDSVVRPNKAGNPFTLTTFKRRVRAKEVGTMASAAALQSLQIDLAAEEAREKAAGQAG